jgi:hypothetical protein
MAPIWGKVNWFKKRKEKLKVLIIWKTKMQVKVQGKAQLKDSICFIKVQIGY